MGQASGEYLKNVDKNWNITVSFIIHMNFDHAWAEHYPVTLMQVLLLPIGRGFTGQCLDIGAGDVAAAIVGVSRMRW